MAIAEAAAWLTVPGRKWSNGMDVAICLPIWARFAQEHPPDLLPRRGR